MGAIHRVLIVSSRPPSLTSHCPGGNHIQQPINVKGFIQRDICTHLACQAPSRTTGGDQHHMQIHTLELVIDPAGGTLSPGQTATIGLTLSPDATVAPGNYSVTVTITAGGGTAKTTLAVRVDPAAGG